jgi:Sulfatase
MDEDSSSSMFAVCWRLASLYRREVRDQPNVTIGATNMSTRNHIWPGLPVLCAAAMLAGTPAAAQQQQRPNIVMIMGDDIGIWNIGAYHRGMMAGRTPNLDRLAAEGMIFTDYYAEASCTAGRANFITGQLPIRTGMTDRNARPGPDHRHGT